nr:hypothetical protein [Tanacetum cinerariifolium]
MASKNLMQMSTDIVKLNRFDGGSFKRWQKKMQFLLATLNVAYVLTKPYPEESENETLAESRERLKFENDDFICRGHILNAMSDPLFDVYQNYPTARDLWNALEERYFTEDATSTKFIVSKFNSYKMKDVKKNLKRRMDNLSLKDLGKHPFIEEQCRLKNKANDDTSKVHVVEEKGKSFKAGGKKPFSLEEEKSLWVDSGATRHVCNDQTMFKTYERSYSMLYMGNHATAQVKGNGKIDLVFTSGNTLTLNDVLHVPYVRNNLVSGSLLNKFGFKLVFESDKFILSKGGKFVGKGYHTGGMFKLNIKDVVNSSVNDVNMTEISDANDASAVYGNCSPSYSSVSPQQNGIAERKNRTLMDMVNSMMSHSGLSSGYWGEALLTTCYILNRVPSKRSIKTPYEDARFDENRFKTIPNAHEISKETVSTEIPKTTEGNNDDSFLDHQQVEPRRSTRQRRQRIFGPDFKMYLVEGDRKGLVTEYTIIYNLDEDPQTYSEAMKSHDSLFWKESVNDEMDSVIGNNTWILVELPPGSKSIKSKWIFKRKLRVDSNDMLIFRTDLEQVQMEKKLLSENFDMKDLGEADVILGNKILRKEKRLMLTQSHYIEKILKRFDSFDCLPVSTPFKVGRLSRHTSSPGKEHWDAVNRVFKYLKKTMDYGLEYSGDPSVLKVSWGSKKQSCLTVPTMEAEFVALASCCKEAEWQRDLLINIPLWPKPMTPISMHFDSQSTLSRAYNQVYNGKSRHIGLRHRQVNQLINDGVITVSFLRSSKNLADPFTKGLPRKLIESTSQGMGLKPMYK